MIRHSRNSHAARKLQARSFIEPELLPIKDLHYGNREFSAFCCYDSDLDTMTLTYELDPYPL